MVAVCCELVSVPNSLFNGKVKGNMERSENFKFKAAARPLSQWRFSFKIPMNDEQGIISH